MNRLLVSITALCFTLQAIAQKVEIGLPTKAYVYKTIGEKKLKMYVDFSPCWKKTDTRPVIVFFHGGSWRGGSVKAFAPQAKYFASRGLVCANVDSILCETELATPPIHSMSRCCD